MGVIDLFHLAADKIGCQNTDIADLNLYPGGRLVVKMKSGRIYDFQTTLISIATLVAPGNPIHIRDMTGIILT